MVDAFLVGSALMAAPDIARGGARFGARAGQDVRADPRGGRRRSPRGRARPTPASSSSRERRARSASKGARPRGGGRGRIGLKSVGVFRDAPAGVGRRDCARPRSSTPSSSTARERSADRRLRDAAARSDRIWAACASTARPARRRRRPQPVRHRQRRERPGVRLGAASPGAATCPTGFLAGGIGPANAARGEPRWRLRARRRLGDRSRARNQGPGQGAGLVRRASARARGDNQHAA